MLRNLLIALLLFLTSQSALAAVHKHGVDYEGKSDPSMIMHHMHIMLNHAVEMAAEGSNLIMIGKMGMANGIDKTSIRHGLEMIKDAEKIAIEVLSGEDMVSLHHQGLLPGTSEQMAYTHKLGEAALDYIDLLKKMYSEP